MKIEIVECRDYVGIGLRLPGDVVEVSEDLAEQFIRQGFAKSIRQKPAKKESGVD